MKTLTNHTAGPRGINLAGGGTHWVEPGQEVSISGHGKEGDPHFVHVGDDKFEVSGALPDLGKAAEHGAQLDLANANLTQRVAGLEGEVASLTEQLDQANAKLKPFLIKDAVAGLDGKNDAHWTQGGEPKVEAVSAIVGSDVTRSEIKEAAPDAKRAA